MKRICKAVSGILIVASMILLFPSTPVSAEWRQDNTGWWYSEGNSWATGWRYINGAWYYFDNSGYMKTGWVYDNGWYYMQSNGSMVHDCQITLSKGLYTFNSNGKKISVKYEPGLKIELNPINEIEFLNVRPNDGQSITDNFIQIPKDSGYYAEPAYIVSSSGEKTFKKGKTYTIAIRIIVKPDYGIMYKDLKYNFKDTGVKYAGNVKTDNVDNYIIFVSGVTCK